MVSPGSLVCPGSYHVQPFYFLIMCVCEFLCQDSACGGQKVLDPPDTELTGSPELLNVLEIALTRIVCALNCSAIAPAPHLIS